MTPKFTTNCLLIIKNPVTINYVVQELIKMGRRDFTLNGFEVNKTKAILAFNDCFTLSMNKSCPLTVEKCSDVTLFIDLAGMREDIDKGQWFTDGEVVWQCPYDKFTGSVYLSPQCPQFEPDKIRRATAEEIINHHKQKGE